MATWLVDVPAAELDRSRQQLLDVRDVLQEATGRRHRPGRPDHWPAWPRRCGLADDRGRAAQVRELGRRTHRTCRRLAVATGGDAVRRPRAGTARAGPILDVSRPASALSQGEVVLTEGRPRHATRCCCSARPPRPRDRNLVLTPPTAARLGRECPPLPDPWPRGGASRAGRGCWRPGPACSTSGRASTRTARCRAMLPEWERVRLLPHASVVHRFTVDRHLVQTCVEAGA